MRKSLVISFLCALCPVRNIRQTIGDGKFIIFTIPLLFLTGLCVSAVMIGCSASGVDSKEVQSAISNPQSEMSQMIQQLGSDDWQIREKAQGELIKMGEGLIQKYRKTLFTTEAELPASREGQRTQSRDKISKFADTLREASRDTNTEIRNRSVQICRYFYDLTQPKIVFTSRRDSNEEIYVMDADGINQTRLTYNKCYDEKPAWSPDGTKIAFVSERDGNKEIYIMPASRSGGNANGKNPIRLTENQAEDTLPAWSPDGTKIAFCSNRDGNFEIYVMDLPDGKAGADGKNLTRLTENTRDNYAPAWSPDGTRISFYSHGDGGGVYLMSADGKNQTKLIDNQADGIRTTWNPDGNKIAFESESGQKHHKYTIYVINTDGKNQTQLIEKPADGLRPTWSPDGTKIAFQSTRDGNYEIYVMSARPSGGDTNGKNQIRLTKDLKGNFSAGWNPLSFPEISILFTLRDEGFAQNEKK